MADHDHAPAEAESPQAILQSEYEPAVPGEVPVRLVNRVRVDQLPLRIGATRSINVSSTDPEQILPENPKRAALTVMVLGTAVRFAKSKEAARRNDMSFVVQTSTVVPLRFHFTDELWVMKTAAGAGTDLLSIMTEDWAR